MKKKIFIISLISMILFSCNQVPNEKPQNSDPGKKATDNPTLPVIENLNSSILQYDKKINLSWTKPDGFTGTYKIYRYTSVLQTLSYVSFDSSINEYNDTSAVQNTPYFYRVTCVLDGEEGYKNDNPSLGILSLNTNYVDIYEPNDKYELITGNSTVFSKDPVIYSISDGNSGVIGDIDWYKYKGIDDLLVNIVVPNNDFNDGDIKVSFYYNGTYQSEHEIKTNGVDNNLSYTSPVNPGTEFEVFFKVWVNTGTVNVTKNIIQTYSITTGL